MGIIKAGITAAESLMDDAWLDLYYCDALSQNTLLVHASKRTNPNSANHGTSENVISRGSRIIVNEGQAAVVVSNGKLIACYTEPGVHKFNGGYEGGLLKEWGRRVAFGGDNVATQQSVFFINLHESMNHRFIVHAPVVVSSGGSMKTVTYVLEGAYCFGITDPEVFYKTLAGNVSLRERYTPSLLTQTFNSEFIDATAQVVSKLSEKGLDILSLSKHSKQLCAAIREQMQSGFPAQHGLGITSVLLTSVSIGGNDTARHQKREDHAWVADSLPKHRSKDYYQKHEDLAWVQKSFETPPAPPAVNPTPSASAPAKPPASPQATAWTCSCGNVNTAKYCTECGKPRPEPWNCTCGQQCTGKFCTNCGKSRPERWKCVCGAENTSRFCTNCGKPKPDESQTIK